MTITEYCHSRGKKRDAVHQAAYRKGLGTLVGSILQLSDSDVATLDAIGNEITETTIANYARSRGLNYDKICAWTRLMGLGTEKYFGKKRHVVLSEADVEILDRRAGK